MAVLVTLLIAAGGRGLMPDYSRVGAGHLAALMHRALERGNVAALTALHAECARRPVADQEACRREWIRQCALRRREAWWRTRMPLGHGPAPAGQPRYDG